MYSSNNIEEVAEKFLTGEILRPCDTVVSNGPMLSVDISTSTASAGKMRNARSVRNAGIVFRSKLPVTRKPLKAKKLGRMKHTSGRSGPVQKGN